jgi:mannan endo-1,4-beta-mannosidase
VHGGPCDKRSQWLLCKDTRSAIKQRLAFATGRWGGSGALFAWDIWNEIHPAHAGNSAEIFNDFVEDISSFLRQTEMRLHGRSHPQTVSVFGPVLNSHPHSAACIFRHPSLDFASTHYYESNTIDYPRNTVDAAISTGRLTMEALAEIKDNRPFFDSEHGPIHLFKDKRKTLPEPFDDEYFRHMQWAHFASGGAGGGMRWPNRHPHSLTAGMRKAQQGLSGFLPLVDWPHFRRQCWNKVVDVAHKSLVPFACGDEHQAILWLMRRDTIGKDGRLRPDAEPITGCVHVPMSKPGSYRLVAWDTFHGKALSTLELAHSGGTYLCVPLPPVRTDMAFVIKRRE